MDKLRDEIIEAQKIRADLIKWKLLLIAGLGAAALGLAGPGDLKKHAVLLLALIPLVSLYVDLAARHLNLRMHVIAKFMRTCGDPEHCQTKYETYISEIGAKKFFSLEDAILSWSTIAVSALLFLGPKLIPKEQIPSLLYFAGAVGVIGALIVELLYRAKVAQIEALRHGLTPKGG